MRGMCSTMVLPSLAPIYFTLDAFQKELKYVIH